MARHRSRAVNALVLVIALAIVASGLASVLAGTAGVARGEDANPAVGTPRHGDRVTYRVQAHAEDASGTRAFTWNGTGDTLDAWGRVVNADRLARTAGEHAEESAFAPGALEPFARLVLHPWQETGCATTVPGAMETCEHRSTQGVVYAHPDRPHSRAPVDTCLLRNGWQGLAFEALTSVPVREACPLFATDAPLEDQGPTRVGDRDARAFSFVTRGGDEVTLAFASGLAYPVHYADANVTLTLRAFEPGDGALVRVDGTPLPPGTRDASLFAPTTPLGPAEAGVDVRFSAADARAAAERAPQSDLAAWRAAHPDAFVTQVHYIDWDGAGCRAERAAATTASWSFRDQAPRSRAMFHSSASLREPCALPAAAWDALAPTEPARTMGYGGAFDEPSPFTAHAWPEHALSWAGAVQLFENARVTSDLPVTGFVAVGPYSWKGEHSPGSISVSAQSPHRDGSLEEHATFDLVTGVTLHRVWTVDVAVTHAAWAPSAR